MTKQQVKAIDVILKIFHLIKDFIPFPVYRGLNED